MPVPLPPIAGFRFDEPAPAAYRRSLSEPVTAAIERARESVAAGDRASAARSAESAAQAAPDAPEPQAMLGAMLLDAGDLAAAAGPIAAALDLAPGWPAAVRLAGEIAFRTNDLPLARILLQKAVALRPDWPEASLRLGEVLLKAGDYAAGWPLLANRFVAAGQAEPSPKWDGVEPLWDQSVLVIAEREVGDLLQFVRYADRLKRKGAVVNLVCPGDLAGLLSTVPGVERALAFEEEMPSVRYVMPMLSLPGLFGTTLATVPADVPYIAPDEGLVDAWRAHFAKLKPDAKLRVGLSWADAGESAVAPVRSIPLAALSPLWDVPDVAFFGLQQGPQQAELERSQTPVVDVSGEITGAPSVVAAVAALDLLIAVDTPAVHVAGAMNRPAWALLAAGCDWRWLGAGETTPWYPSVRCFRQIAPGEWNGVARRAAEALRERMTTWPWCRVAR